MELLALADAAEANLMAKGTNRRTSTTQPAIAMCRFRSFTFLSLSLLLPESRTNMLPETMAASD